VILINNPAAFMIDVAERHHSAPVHLRLSLLAGCRRAGCLPAGSLPAGAAERVHGQDAAGNPCEDRSVILDIAGDAAAARRLATGNGERLVVGRGKPTRS
jgi:hypothetical protein